LRLNCSSLSYENEECLEELGRKEVMASRRRLRGEKMDVEKDIVLERCRVDWVLW
jgi:hypothetical protein